MAVTRQSTQVAEVRERGGRRRGPTPGSNGTPDRILEVAEQLVQTRGFNGISYADVASELGITKASLHYHFAAKSDLGVRLIERYSDNFQRALAGIDASGADPSDRLDKYIGIYQSVLERNRMCLCGMLAAEHATLPAEMVTRLNAFFDANERWLAALLERGRRSGSFTVSGSAKEQARFLVGSLEGAMLVARSYGDPSRFTQAAARLTATLAPAKQQRTESARHAR